MRTQSSKLQGVLILLLKTIHLASLLRPRIIRLHSRLSVPFQNMRTNLHTNIDANSPPAVDNEHIASEEPNYLTEYLSKLGKDTSACVVPREAVPTNALIVKSLLWTYQKQFPVLLVLSLADTVDKPKLAKYLQTNGSSKQMRMATPALVLEVTGQTVGNVSPLGHKQTVRTIVDEALIQRYNIDLTAPWDASQLSAQADGALCNDVMCYGGGGSNGMELQISLRELLYWSAAEVGPISSTPSADSAQPDESGSASVSTPSSPVPDTSASASENGIVVSNNISARTMVEPAQSSMDATMAKSIRDLAIDKNGSAALSTLLATLTARLGDAQLLRSILDQGTASSGKTALHLASWKGSIESVRALLTHGADVNKWSVGTGNYGKTAIFYAITQCRDDVVMELLSQGANVKIVNNKGQTPRSLGPSHLAEDTILAIEKAESAQAAEWLNFYTTNYCEANTCFGDLDPRFHELGQELRTASVCAENADLAPFPRSINATTFEFRRNHFKSYSKANHMVEELVVALMNCSSSANVKDVLIENENVEDALLNGVIDVAPSCTLVGYVTALEQLSSGALSAVVVPVVEYWNSSPQNESPASVHEDKPFWNLRSGEETKREAVSVRLLWGKTVDLASAPPAVLTEWTKSLRVGQLVLAKGTLLESQPKPLSADTNVSGFRDFMVRNFVVFNTSSGAAASSADSTAATPATVDSPNTTMRGCSGGVQGVDVSAGAEKSIATEVAAESESVLEYVTLADVADSFVPSQDNTEAPSTVPVIVVNNLATILAFEKDIAEMVSLADSGEHHTHGSAGVQQFKNKLRTVVAIDCEWWSGQDYNKTRQSRSETTLAVQSTAEVSSTVASDAVPRPAEVTDGTTGTDVDAVADVGVSMGVADEVEVDARHDAEVDAAVAIMQLATRRAAYLIDLQTLCATLPCITTSSAGALPPQEQQALLARLNAALEAIFSNRNILKLGFKVAPDFEKVCASYPAMSCFQRIHGVMDTHTMTQQLVPALIKAKKLPADWHAGHKLKQLGLSKLCQLVMHKCLDKTQQCSTWHIRPLTPEQLVYGALDVATVLHIFDFFTGLEYLADSSTALTAAVLRQHKLYRVFTANLKFYLPSLAADSRITATPLRTLHHLLLERERTHTPAVHEKNISQSLNPGTRGVEMPKIGTSSQHKGRNRGSASCKKIVGLDMVAQSWTAQQEEPVDYGVQLKELLTEGQFTAESLAETAAAEAKQLQQQQRFKGRLSDMFAISAPVTAFLQQYRDGSLCSACLSDTVADVKIAPLPAGLPFLGQFIAQSKETCVDFCQALLQLQFPTVVTSSAPSAVPESSTNAGKKNIGGMVLLNSTLILFVHCAALKTTVVQVDSARDAPAARKAAAKSAAKAESNLFLGNGRYFTWSIEASAVVKNNSPRVSKTRSFLLQSLIADGSTYLSAVDISAGASTPVQTVLLFVRQNAAPYVFCGRCSVASLETQLGSACSVPVAALAPNGNAGDSAGSAEGVVKVLFELTDYDQLFSVPKAGSDESTSEYSSMIAQHTGARTFK